MASQSQGIQQLLQAEKRAAEKVADARKSESPLPPLEVWKENWGCVDSKHLSPEVPKPAGERAGGWDGWLEGKKWVSVRI